MAQFDHGQHNLLGTREQRFNRTVAAVAHPAFDAELNGGQFGPGAKAYALHLTPDDHKKNHVHPNSSSLRGPALPRRLGNQRRSD
jgi:hypothetical protein